MSRLLSAAAIVFALPCLPQSADTALQRRALFTADRRAAADAADKKDQPGYRNGLAKLHADFPLNSRIVRNLAVVEAELGNTTAVRELLRQYAAMGGTLELKLDSWAALREAAKEVPQLARNEAPVQQGVRAFRLKDPGLLVEDVAYDAAGKRFYLSSVRQKKILRCDAVGLCEDFIGQSPEVPLDAIFALSVDSSRHVLWATTGDLDGGKSALLQFDLSTRKLLRRLQPADDGKHTMGDMTMAANGDLYVSDGNSGDVFLVSQQRGTLEKLAPPGVFLSPQTPALSADGKFLYVPDYALGIAVIRLRDRHIEWLQSSIPAALEGIDGFYNTGGRFIAVQNGTQPPRIVELQLGSHGELDKVTVLEANWEGFGQPTHGVQVGRDFFFIVNSGWDRLGEKGEFKPGDPAELWKLSIPR